MSVFTNSLEGRSTRSARRRMVSLALALAWLAGSLLASPLATPGWAHESRPVSLQLRETQPGRFDVVWHTPVSAGRALPIRLTLPAGVRDLREPVVQRLTDSLVERRWIDAGPHGLEGGRIGFVGLELTITDALVRAEMHDGRTWTAIARPSRPWIEAVASQSRGELVATYVAEGVRHILEGADHLLFVVGLVLIVSDRRVLLGTVTAFTLAHSLTLALATLGVADVPLAPLNAAVALSILFLGPEIVRTWRGETSFTLRHPWVVAFAFGLLHGFGFASALTGAGLPRGDVPLALVGFNAGVELGQLGLIALVLAGERVLRVLNEEAPFWLRLIPGYAVGTLGAFWTVQRVAVLLGMGG